MVVFPPPWSAVRLNVVSFQVYVDALGPTKSHEAFLSSLFPGIRFTVEAKADAKYKIVSAASIAAKVTRDGCLEGWVWEEAESMDGAAVWDSQVGSGYPGGGGGGKNRAAPF